MSSHLSPIDIEHANFESAPMGFRKSAVKAFLQRVSAELEDLLQQQRRSQEQLEEQGKRIGELQESEAEMKRAVIAAERIGAEIKENARREAELLVEQAKVRAESLLREVEAELAAAHAELSRLERSQSIVREQLRGQLSGFLKALDDGRPLRRSFAPAQPQAVQLERAGGQAAPTTQEAAASQAAPASQAAAPVSEAEAELHTIGEEDLQRS